MVIAVVPVKPLCRVKGRLSAAYPLEYRQALCLAMLEDLLRKLEQTGCFSRICVMSREERLAGWLAQLALPASLLSDPRDLSLNASAALAAVYCRRFDNAMLFIHADLPLARPNDILLLLEALRDRDLALAADRNGTGTTALAAWLPLPVVPRFGPDSLARHIRQCQEAGLHYRVVGHERLGLDVDRPEDLRNLTALLDPRSEPALHALLRSPRARTYLLHDSWRQAEKQRGDDEEVL